MSNLVVKDSWYNLVRILKLTFGKWYRVSSSKGSSTIRIIPIGSITPKISAVSVMTCMISWLSLSSEELENYEIRIQDDGDEVVVYIINKSQDKYYI